MKKFLAFSCFYSLLLALALLFACVTTEETNRKQLNFIPDSQMNAMGVQAYDEILKTEKLSSNAALTAQVVEIGKNIAAASGKNFAWDFKLIDEAKMVNAFCLPGGKVAVYTGILPLAQNNAALAAVLGHEVAHAVLKHGAERMSQTVLLQLGIAATALSFNDERQRPLIMGALGLGAQFGVLLPFGRQHESEADAVGLRYMAKAGYDPKESIGLWERMGKMSGARPPEFMSTHPDPLRRARALEGQQGEVASMYEQSKKIKTEKLKV